MARVKLEGIIDHLSHQVKGALGTALEQIAPNSGIDTSVLFRAFMKAVSRKCSTWEQVPSQFVED